MPPKRTRTTRATAKSKSKRKDSTQIVDTSQIENQSQTNDDNSKQSDANPSTGRINDSIENLTDNSVRGNILFLFSYHLQKFNIILNYLMTKIPNKEMSVGRMKMIQMLQKKIQRKTHRLQNKQNRPNENQRRKMPKNKKRLTNYCRLFNAI